MDRRSFILAGTALAGISLAGGTRASAALQQVLFDPDAPALGNAKGDLTIVEYFDYQCPYCRSNHPMLMDEVRRDGNIRLVMKDLPVLGPVSRRAARMALGSVDLGLYAAVNAALMATRGRLSDRSVDSALRRAGVSPDAAWKSFTAQEDKWERLIVRNLDQADDLGFWGTPSYVIGQVIAPGVIDRQALRETIAEARQIGMPSRG